MFKAIINDFKEYKSKLSDFFALTRFNIKFKFYSKLTDMSCKASGIKTRLVIVGEDRKMEIWNKRTIKRYKAMIKTSSLVMGGDGSTKRVTKKHQGRIPKSWGNIELNKITFYIARPNQKLSSEERAEYRDKFNMYAKHFLRNV